VIASSTIRRGRVLNDARGESAIGASGRSPSGGQFDPPKRGF